MGGGAVVGTKAGQEERIPDFFPIPRVCLKSKQIDWIRTISRHFYRTYDDLLVRVT